MSGWLLDGLLAVGLLWLGWRTVVIPDLFRAIILFIVFGLVLTLCWARLGALDVALAEAAIGTGLTGALLLDAYRALWVDASTRERRSSSPSVYSSLVLGLLCSALAGGLIWVLLTLPEAPVNLGRIVIDRLAESGVTNPVTAVLLNFRGYDTLLEVGVLLLALLGVWTLSTEDENAVTPVQSDWLRDSLLVDALIRLLVPLLILIGLYLLWTGTHAPGGAFQAGTVLAAIGVILRLGERIAPAPEAGFILRGILSLGLGVFSLVALGVAVMFDSNLLEYPPSWAGVLILAIETVLTLSIAMTLTLLFSGGPGIRSVPR